MERHELEALYALFLSDGIGNVRAIALCGHFGDPVQALNATRSELCSINGFGGQLVNRFIQSRGDAAERSKRNLDSLSSDTSCLSYFDQEYPSQLKSIYSPPLLLFVQGNADLLNRDRIIAIVGTRKMTTDYGRRITEEMSSGLAQNGVCISSGFALGVDSCAHRAAFDAGGETIAVLGTGIDVTYPPQNKGFARELTESRRGALISEFPVGTAPDPNNFPWRNRIVSGLARACIVVESDEKGGSMITAEIAQDQGKILYAVPGDIYKPTSKGPNSLLASSRAKFIRNSSDVLKDLGWASSQVTEEKSNDYGRRSELTFTESAIVGILDSAGTPIHIDTLSERAGIGIQDLLVALLDLEFRDVVRQHPGKYFSSVF